MTARRALSRWAVTTRCALSRWAVTARCALSADRAGLTVPVPRCTGGRCADLERRLGSVDLVERLGCIRPGAGLAPVSRVAVLACRHGCTRRSGTLFVPSRSSRSSVHRHPRVFKLVICDRQTDDDAVCQSAPARRACQRSPGEIGKLSEGSRLSYAMVNTEHMVSLSLWAFRQHHALVDVVRRICHVTFHCCVLPCCYLQNGYTS